MCLLKGCVKFVVFAFNLIFVLVGIALIAIGTFYQIKLTEVTKAIPDPYSSLSLIPILTIVIGSIIFLISSLGCCGAIKNSPCLLTTYAVILLIIFIAQIALGVFTFLEVKNRDDLSKNINRTIDSLFHKTEKIEVQLVDIIQKELKCCGTNGPNSWGRDIPESCLDDKKHPYSKGCQTAFYDFLINEATIVGTVVLVLSLTEVLGATFSLCLSNSARNDIRRNQYY